MVHPSSLPRRLAPLLLALPFVASACGGGSGGSQPRLVLLYAACTVNKDYLQPYDAEVDYTPNFQAFAAEGATFEKHISEAGQSGIAFASIFSGCQSYIHKAYNHPFRLPDALYQVSEAFRDGGYDTYFWSGQQVASAQLNYGQGVPRERSYLRTPRNSFQQHPANGWEHYSGNDAEMDALLDGLMADPDRKAFVQLNLSLSHGPYQLYAPPPVLQEFLRRFPHHKPAGLSDADIQHYIHKVYAPKENYRPLQWNFPETRERLGLDDAELDKLIAVLELYYKASIYNLDKMFGKLIERIRARGLYDDCLIAFTADHGEVLWRENALYKWTHGLQLAPEVLNVPFLLRSPSHDVDPQRYDGVTRSIDVYPTIAGMCGIEIPADAPVEGLDVSAALFGADPPPLVAYSHTSTLTGALFGEFRQHTLAARHIPRPDDVQHSWVGARREDWTFKHTYDGQEFHWEAYDLATDPGETTNRFDPSDPSHVDMQRRLQAYRQRLVELYNKPPEMTAEDVKNLQDLGYVGDDAEPGG